MPKEQAEECAEDFIAAYEKIVKAAKEKGWGITSTTVALIAWDIMANANLFKREAPKFPEGSK